VAAVFVKPSQLLVTVAHFRLMAVVEIAVFPVSNSNISFSPSGLPQASTKMERILTHLLVRVLDELRMDLQGWAMIAPVRQNNIKVSKNLPTVQK